MKLRYIVGIPVLLGIGYMGGNMIIEAIVIGILSGLTDMMKEERE